MLPGAGQGHGELARLFRMDVSAAFMQKGLRASKQAVVLQPSSAFQP